MLHKTSKRHWPFHGWIGLALVAIFWALNWSLADLRTHWAFFPMWLGYCLTVDAFVFLRKGHSMMTRSHGAYIGLFFISITVWWLFELLNLSTQNWFYDGRQYFTDFQYSVIASINFSTVIPAVFGSAELIGTFKSLSQMHGRAKLILSQSKLIGFFICGWLMLAMLFLWPGYFFVFMWLSLFFIIEPVNIWLGNRSLLRHLSNGDWRPLLALWIGCLICGFFWEMWNFYSYPKWIYNVPFVDFWHVFEMPLIGYLGYLPFSLELFAIYNFIMGLFGINGKDDFVQIGI